MPDQHYTRAVHTRLACSWNTWWHRSVLCHAHLPSGIAINLGVKEYDGGCHAREFHIGAAASEVRPELHAYDGAYTECTVDFRGVRFRVQTAVEEGEQYLLVTPETHHLKAPLLIVEGGLLWNRPGCVQRDGGTLVATTPEGTVMVYTTAAPVDEPQLDTMTPCLALTMDEVLGISTGAPCDLETIRTVIARHRDAALALHAQYGALAETHAAMQNAQAWNTYYDPIHDRVVTTVSRRWFSSAGWGLFTWDTFFAAMMIGMDAPDLAYALACAMCEERSPEGFFPNLSGANGYKSLDRSQPPVGSIAVSWLYERHWDRDFVAAVFDDLLTWNRWWMTKRLHHGYLCWGPNPFTPRMGGTFETWAVGEAKGAMLESGLDNSPMYDDVPFNAEAGVLELADVMLNSLYVRDCQDLAVLARAIGRVNEAEELEQRAEAMGRQLLTLWNEELGIFCNKRTDTGEFSPRLSPGNFFPLMTGLPTQAQAVRMIAEHFDNPAEFAGDWILPSIARNDPGYPDQNYWRGRIWGPLNFLAYLSLLQHDVPAARQRLAEQSNALLMKEWREHCHVHENYCGDTGAGTHSEHNDGQSDAFYTWGGLLGFIALIEDEQKRMTPHD